MWVAHRSGQAELVEEPGCRASTRSWQASRAGCIFCSAPLADDLDLSGLLWDEL
jgi:hypothetical protein